ncbi:Transcriptional regulator in cluster with unspecified monosaccharide ABC transport system [Streptococcus sp. DD10]|uniref:helix-turn-helix domain-containing protein n=1 Tax=Streptococcus sp. DD10 TaxID=1777878 RepID=UPI00079B9134|nr:helix-turn-helix domain-containing protein [Streptococcus sp. DD10]KXT74265.1 Transcriptional regulator in cluster with unspecified monosaccharide ABC transport system [Streptococcus sp. DD10]
MRRRNDEKKTIGEVFFLERRNQGLSLEDIEQKADIQLDYLKMIEKDDFDHLPSSFYVRSFLKKYAKILDLDEEIILNAYEQASLLTYDEIEVLPFESRRMRRVRRNKSSFLPLFYLTLLSLSVVIFISYFLLRNYQQNQTLTTDTSVSIVSDAVSFIENVSSSELEVATPLEIETESASDFIIVTASNGDKPVTLSLSVDDTTSWISISDTVYADGVTLSDDNPRISTELSPATTTDIILGNTTGLTVKINEQNLDLASLTNLAGTIRLTVKG